jgi:hypothetical protein
MLEHIGKNYQNVFKDPKCDKNRFMAAQAQSLMERIL